MNRIDDYTADTIAQFSDTITSLDSSTVLVNMNETPVWFDNPTI